MTTTEWRSWCKGQADLKVASGALVVELGDDRRQVVQVTAGEDCLELSSNVLRPGLVKAEDVVFRAWRRNRITRLVGFKVDKRGWLIATAWTPIAGLTAAEFVALVRRIAREADLFEYQLTGADRE